MFKQSKPQVKTISVWSKDSNKIPKECLMCTNRKIFHNIDEAAEMLTGYIKLCVNSIVIKK